MALGYSAGYEAVHTNSTAIGRYSGRTARGNDRMYLDTYQSDPNYAADGATNDTIFMDSDGKLYLGGGAGRATNANAGGVLRGPWTSTSFLATNGNGSALTGITASQVGADAAGTAAAATQAIDSVFIAAAGGLTNTAILPIVVETVTTCDDILGETSITTDSRFAPHISFPSPASSFGNLGYAVKR
jgi:hypothetical protein